MKKITENSKAFTMIETLVSVAIFAFISVVLVNIFVAAINTQMRILRNQELMEQSSYSLEYMGKILRTAYKDATGSCTGTANTNFGVGTNSLTFLAYDRIAGEYYCRQFLLDSSALKERRSTSANSTDLGTAQAITSSKVKVDGLTFAVTGDTVSDLLQPKVTIMIRMKSNVTDNPPQITIQTSVSQRNLDI
jgi:type II secretory pathway component PulJ